MSDAKHTPTLALPLRASTTHSCEVHIFDRNDEKVASIVSYTGDLTTAQLDHADLIVAACNSHDALVAALEEALEYFEQREDVRDGPSGEQLPNTEMSMAQALRAALALSRGGKT